MGRPIRILHVRVDGVFGGVERLILDYLRLLDRERFDSVVAPLMNEALLAEGAKELGIPVEFVPMRSRFDRSAAQRLEHIIRERDIDLAIAYGIRADCTVSRAARNAGIPWISDVQTLIYYDYANPIQGRLFYHLDRWFLRSADAIKLCAGYIKTPLSSGVLKLRNLVILPNAVTLPDADEGGDVTRLREALGLSERSPVILCAARLMQHYKGQNYLIQAVPGLLEKFPDLVVLLAGTGCDERRLQALAERLGVSDRVRFIGFRDDVPDLLRLTSVYVCPSTHEGLPFSILEAISRKVPVVATSVGGIPELLAEWSPENLIPSRQPNLLAQAITRVLSNPSEAKQTACRGFEWLRSRFNWDVVMPRFERLIESIVARQEIPKDIDCRAKE